MLDDEIIVMGHPKYAAVGSDLRRHRAEPLIRAGQQVAVVEGGIARALASIRKEATRRPVGSVTSAVPRKRGGTPGLSTKAWPAAAVKPPNTSTCRMLGVMVFSARKVAMGSAVLPRGARPFSRSGRPPKKVGAPLAVEPNTSPAAFSP